MVNAVASPSFKYSENLQGCNQINLEHFQEKYKEKRHALFCNKMGRNG
jgi:hypothetical protein